MLFIHPFCYVLSVPLFYSKIVLLSFSSSCWLLACILHLLLLYRKVLFCLCCLSLCWYLFSLLFCFMNKKASRNQALLQESHKKINTRAVPFVKYSGLFLIWTKEGLRKMDQRTRKWMMMHKSLYPRHDIRKCICIKKGRKRTRRHWWMYQYEGLRTMLKRV